IPRDAYGFPTGVPVGAPLKRVSVNTYNSPTPDASDATTDNANVYNRSTSPQLRIAIATSEGRSDFSDGSALTRTEFYYDNSTTTGNRIQEKSWDSTKGALTRPLGPANSISVSHTYDPYGNLTSTTDARGYVAQLVYDGNNLYPTQSKRASGTP